MVERVSKLREATQTNGLKNAFVSNGIDEERKLVECSLKMEESMCRRMCLERVLDGMKMVDGKVAYRKERSCRMSPQSDRL